MRTDTVEIYSDQSNAAVLRHPQRKFPGVLIQGDSLHAICRQADDILADVDSLRGTGAYDDLNDLRNRLWDYLIHCKVVLGEHGIPLPFSENTRF
ncbi:hypothetical protein [Lysobacter sp. Root983]|uniref:DUF6959 family protein n=1 Tax=Lysobacter sp. Root983 TaxID=1736613 RepID=UPI00070C7A25|nr:hypothetical protein [Lysobacter sp. Root983]KRD74512.1 hypothetical protein ASE43_14815 [Lysobacter sp. Root983]